MLKGRKPLNAASIKAMKVGDNKNRGHPELLIKSYLFTMVK